MRHLGLLLACLVLSACSGAEQHDEQLGQAEEPLSTGVVISQVYGGGGNGTALYTSDYVELFNRGGSTVSLSGWSVQYAASLGSSWSAFALPAKSIPPGGYFLIKLYTDTTTGGLALPAADATGSLSLSATSGKIALVGSTTALSCGLACAGKSGVIDFVGYGLASDYEGSGAAPLASVLTSAQRSAAGCTETDDNASDFASAAPVPRNSATAKAVCPGVDAGTDTGAPDTGAPDTGTIAIDSGSPDTGTAVVDTGTSAVDTGTAADSGTSEPDASTVDGTTPEDGSTADGSTSDAATEDTETDASLDAKAADDTGTARHGTIDDLPAAKPACGCRTPGAPISTGAAPLLLGLVIAMRRRRR
ncbi:MAG: lamin tail domain-containing protein [Polyangiales bacterium]